MPVVEMLRARRVAARPDALDRIAVPGGAVLLRLAPDDALVLGDGPVQVDDLHAIVEEETGFVAATISESRALELIGSLAAWQPPAKRPCLVQGMLAGLPAKLWLDGQHALVIVPTPFGHELVDRLR